MKLKILKVKDGSFVGNDGTEQQYFWYTAQRVIGGNPVRFQFGSRFEHELGDADLELYQEEGRSGKLVWKEDTAGLGA